MKAVLFSAILASSVAFAAEVTIDLPPGDYIISPIPPGSYVLSVPDTSVPVDPPVDPVDPPVDPVDPPVEPPFEPELLWEGTPENMVLGYSATWDGSLLTFPTYRSVLRQGESTTLTNRPVTVVMTFGNADVDGAIRIEVSQGSDPDFLNEVFPLTADGGLQTLEMDLDLTLKGISFRISNAGTDPIGFYFESIKIFSREAVDPVDPPVDPVDPPVDPVDPPVDPVDPPVGGEPLPVFQPITAELCAEFPTRCTPVVEDNYIPTIKPLSIYTEDHEAYFPIDESWPQVTVKDWETLNSARDRLQYRYQPGQGAIINVPWDINTPICDHVRFISRTPDGPLVIRGVVGPNGELPEYYCRRTDRQGTVEKVDAQGEWGYFDNASPLLFQNLEIDGYRKVMAMPRNTRTVWRSSWMHHMRADGFSQGNTEKETETGFLADMVFAGNEISHCGAWNSTHCMYIHRSRIPESTHMLTVVDNFAHTAFKSSVIKSIANINIIKRNTFKQRHITGIPQWDNTSLQSAYLIDITACSSNVVEGNTLHSNKSEDGGETMVGLRNRKSIQGCDTPQMYLNWRELGPLSEDAEKGLTPEPNPEFWAPEVWAAMNGQDQFYSYIRNNHFINDAPYDLFGERSIPIANYGTYPNRVYKGFGFACLIEPPVGWFERSQAIVENNTFTGFSNALWEVKPPGHKYTPDNPDDDDCGYDIDFKPPYDLDSYFTIGDNTVFPPPAL